MVSGQLTDERDTYTTGEPLESSEELNRTSIQIAALVTVMMRLERSDRKDWQGFTRILEVLSFLDEIENRSPQEIEDAVQKFCELPPNPGQTMSMEEVVFWAGVASGMEFWRHAEEDGVDPNTAEKMLIFSSIFAHSMKNAIVDLALGDLEPESRKNWEKLSRVA